MNTPLYRVEEIVERFRGIDGRIVRQLIRKKKLPSVQIHRNGARLLTEDAVRDNFSRIFTAQHSS